MSLQGDYCPISYQAVTVILHYNHAYVHEVWMLEVVPQQQIKNKFHTVHIAATYTEVKQSLRQCLYSSCPSLNLSRFPFDQTTKARRQLFSRKSVTLPSSTLDWLQPLSLIFLQAVTIHCLWHSPVGSLTPFNQINFIFLSMPCNWMSQMGRDVTWFRMSIFWQQFYLQFLQDLESRYDGFI